MPRSETVVWSAANLGRVVGQAVHAMVADKDSEPVIQHRGKVCVPGHWLGHTTMAARMMQSMTVTANGTPISPPAPLVSACLNSPHLFPSTPPGDLLTQINNPLARLLRDLIAGFGAHPFSLGAVTRLMTTKPVGADLSQVITDLGGAPSPGEILEIAAGAEIHFADRQATVRLDQVRTSLWRMYGYRDTNTYKGEN